MNADNRIPCDEHLKKLKILPLHSQYLKSVALFVVKNTDDFVFNSEFLSISTRYRSDLHIPTERLTKYQKCVYYLGIRIFNYLPQNIKAVNMGGMEGILCSFSCQFEVKLFLQNINELFIHTAGIAVISLCKDQWLSAHMLNRVRGYIEMEICKYWIRALNLWVMIDTTRPF
jgi:hypothetical protein